MKQDETKAIAELVASAKNGDVESFNLLYQKTWQPVYYSLMNRLRNEEEVRALLNEVYVKVYVNLNRLENDMAFIAWLHKILQNTYLYHLKTKKRQKVVELYEFVEDYDVRSETDDDYLPDLSYEKNEMKETIRQAVESLPEAQRSAIFLFYYQNLSIREIAEVTQSGESAVRKRLHDAKKTLKSRIEDLMKKGGGISSMAMLSDLMRDFYIEDIAENVPDEIGRIVWEQIAGQLVLKQPWSMMIGSGAFKSAACAATFVLVIYTGFIATRSSEAPGIVTPENSPAISQSAEGYSTEDGDSRLWKIEQEATPASPITKLIEQATEAADLSEAPAAGSEAEDIFKEPEVFPAATAPTAVSAEDTAAIQTAEESPREALGNEASAEQEVSQGHYEQPVEARAGLAALPSHASESNGENNFGSGDSGSESYGVGGSMEHSGAPAVTDESFESRPSTSGGGSGGYSSTEVSPPTNGEVKPIVNVTREFALSYEVNEVTDRQAIITDVVGQSGVGLDVARDDIRVGYWDFNGGKPGKYRIELTINRGGSAGVVKIHTDIDVSDSISPEISVDSPRLNFAVGAPVELSEIIRLAGVQVRDNSGEDITPVITGYERIDFSSVGIYVLNISAADSSGNEALRKNILIYLK